MTWWSSITGASCTGGGATSANPGCSDTWREPTWTGMKSCPASGFSTNLCTGRRELHQQAKWNGYEFSRLGSTSEACSKNRRQQRCIEILDKSRLQPRTLQTNSAKVRWWQQLKIYIEGNNSKVFMFWVLTNGPGCFWFYKWAAHFRLEVLIMLWLCYLLPRAVIPVPTHRMWLTSLILLHNLFQILHFCQIFSFGSFCFPKEKES